jgi:hypothetical protein
MVRLTGIINGSSWSSSGPPRVLALACVMGPTLGPAGVAGMNEK